MPGPGASRGRPALATAELAALAVAIGLAFWLGEVATRAWLERAGAIPGARVPAAAFVRSLARRAELLFSAGVAILAAARLVSLRRGRDPLAVPWLLPAAVLACLLGLVVHHATVDLAYRTEGALRVPVVAPPSAATFAGGFLLGSIAAAGILVVPLDLAALARRAQTGVALLILGLLVALAVAGTGPGASGVRINLGPLQPIEAVKPLVVVFLAAFLGARAPKLRWQRQRLLGLRWPRLALLVPALLVLVLILAGLFVVGDLGPVFILALVFLGMFTLVTRASGFAAAALATVAAAIAAIARWPWLVDVGRVATRLRMWQDPWGNGLPHGGQLGEGLWALAAGGWRGQGLAWASAPLVPAGKTDLALAILGEQLGAAGIAAYLVLVAAVALAGFRVAARGRTAEHVLLAGGAALLVVVQLALIHAGTFGLLPLTGIVVPFLSSGRSSMVAFLAVVGLLARLAEDARPRAPSAELDELHRGARALAAAAALLLAGGLLAAADVAAARADLSARTITSRLRDGTVVRRPNPRLAAMARTIRRGEILDRHGEPLAHGGPVTHGEPLARGAPVTHDAPLAHGAPARGYPLGPARGYPLGPARGYPLGPAMGTLLGRSPSGVLLPPWALERVLDERLCGHGQVGGAPDLRSFVPLLLLPREERARRLAALDAAIAERSVRLSIDARLQRRVAALLEAAVAAGRGPAAAAVVLDVDTGQVLARAQAPDLDPNDPGWDAHLVAGDASLTGAYGPWPDKTGVQGMFQAGSVGKLATALAAARAGWRVEGTGCEARADVWFACTERDAQGPLFTRPGWPKPIHDHARDPLHGRVDVVEALAVSCNVFFGQLGLALGPGPLAELAQAGAEVGYTGDRPFDPGAAGSRHLASTAFGQGSLVLSVLQAARLTAAIGAGGRYRRCPPTMELAAPCVERALLDDATALAPILAGMRRVMTHGTGRGLRPPPGVRVYGKTGTADVGGFAGEAPWGIAPAAAAPPHSWFVALAEPAADVRECELAAPGRLAVAVVVPRGGAGAAAAGPLAMEILAAARSLGYLGGEQPRP